MPAEEDPTIRRGPGAVAPPQVEWGRPLPPAPRRPRRLGPGLLVIGMLGAAAGLGGWWLLRPGPAPERATRHAERPGETPAAAALPALRQAALPAPAPATAQAVAVAVPLPGPAPAPEPAPAASRLASLPPLWPEAAIRAHRAASPALFRLAERPAVFLMDFPSLAQQGAALNRVAALLEKAGLPRDRVLAPAEMAAAIAQSGDTAATFYFGHNYRGEGLARFFALADQQGQALAPEEEWVRAQYTLARGLVPAGQEIVLLSLAAPGPEMDEAGRATILQHEISHGRFGTDRAYAAHVRLVWRERFEEADRAAIRHFLAREGYDTGIEELVIDEAQAYLLHTPDPRFFTAAHLGLDAAGVERLRALLRDGLPPG
ncbi:hypothetical protein [Falsiroseomonas selenitidurans]|uniref:Uncharacterized protein n=1 Tax=Falsiroseomonas selenitidurans TaxID=2716335 RepID=A0ABX1EA30_9PROT|nr:hypothetical protein [Falsiroseomonas selenitidurans]NKC34094.1 hypothetical protein [Falsiroseomonas selenitidurans]